jgi:hypothetical protein
MVRWRFYVVKHMKCSVLREWALLWHELCTFWLLFFFVIWLAKVDSLLLVGLWFHRDCLEAVTRVLRRILENFEELATITTALGAKMPVQEVVAIHSHD